jgi:hypothetical protein
VIPRATGSPAKIPRDQLEADLSATGMPLGLAARARAVLWLPER